MFDHPDISWDTFIESALILCFKNQSQCQRATKLAAERLAERKRSAVYKRTQTMAKKFIQTTVYTNYNLYVYLLNNSAFSSYAVLFGTHLEQTCLLDLSLLDFSLPNRVFVS